MRKTLIILGLILITFAATGQEPVPNPYSPSKTAGVRMPDGTKVCSPGTEPTSGKVLKFDGACWDSGTDNTGGGGGSLTVEEADGNPSVSTVGAMQFNQASGFTVVDENDGQVQVNFTITDSLVPNDITASNYCLLSGCALTGASSITSNFTLGATALLQWGSSGVSSSDVFFARDAAGVLKVYGAEGGNSSLGIYADEGDDNADKWKLTAHTDGHFGIYQNTSEVLSLSSSGVIGIATIPGSLVTNTPAGDIAADDVQEAINELDAEKSPLFTVEESDDSPSVTTKVAQYNNVHFTVTDEGGGQVQIDLNDVPWDLLTGVPAFRKTLMQLRPQGYEPPPSSFATMFTRNGHPGLSFDGDVCAMWTFVMPNWYGGNGVTVDLWIVSSETSNDTDWDGSWERIATTQDIDSDSFATAISADNNNNNATSGIPTKVSIAFTDGAQMDSCAADELCRFRVCRDATSDTGGTTNGQAVLIGGQIRETP
jgi:hypothetical protein